MQELPDLELIERFLKNDLSAFEVLYERYKKQLYAYLNRLIPGQPLIADEIFQQTWIRIIRQIPNYRHNEKFMAWTIRISHNLAIDHFRKSKNEQIEDFSEKANLFPSEKLHPEKDLDRKELAKALEKCVGKLPDEQREVFLLRQENISFKDISDIQKCSINTSLGRMQYAIRNLQLCLSEWKPGR